MSVRTDWVSAGRDLNFVNFATSTDHQSIVASQTENGVARRIVITSLFLNVNAAVNVYFESFDGVATYTQISGTLYGGAQGQGYVRPQSNFSQYFRTIAGQALTIKLSGAVLVSGDLTYVLL